MRTIEWNRIRDPLSHPVAERLVEASHVRTCIHHSLSHHAYLMAEAAVVMEEQKEYIDKLEYAVRAFLRANDGIEDYNLMPMEQEARKIALEILKDQGDE